MSQYLCKSRYGQVVIEADQDLIMAKFTGSISEKLVVYFINTLDLLVNEVSSSWGYVSYSDQVEAATPEAFDKLVKAASKCHKLGCVKAAYVLKSPIAISQTRTMRERIGVQEPIEDVLFDDIDEAKQFLRRHLHP